MNWWSDEGVQSISHVQPVISCVQNWCMMRNIVCSNLTLTIASHWSLLVLLLCVFLLRSLGHLSIVHVDGFSAVKMHEGHSCGSCQILSHYRYRTSMSDPPISLYFDFHHTLTSTWQERLWGLSFGLREATHQQPSCGRRVSLGYFTCAAALNNMMLATDITGRVDDEPWVVFRLLAALALSSWTRRRHPAFSPSVQGGVSLAPTNVARCLSTSPRYSPRL